MSDVEQLAREIFVADNWASKNPDKLWEDIVNVHQEYAFRIARALIASGWAKGGAA